MARYFKAGLALSLCVVATPLLAEQVTSSTVHVSIKRVDSALNIPLLCVGYDQIHEVTCAQMPPNEDTVRLIRNFEYQTPPKQTKVTALLRWDRSLIVDKKSCSNYPYKVKSSVRTFNGGLQDYTAVTFTLPVRQEPGASGVNLVFNGKTNTLSCSAYKPKENQLASV
ncbi:MAG: hypothetical protein P1U40_12435 [Coxiellaceae bacterium]|nr:hypothetical protein [Coxiellaceae bacterium]